MPVKPELTRRITLAQEVELVNSQELSQFIYNNESISKEKGFVNRDLISYNSNITFYDENISRVFINGRLIHGSQLDYDSRFGCLKLPDESYDKQPFEILTTVNRQPLDMIDDVFDKYQINKEGSTTERRTWSDLKEDSETTFRQILKDLQTVLSTDDINVFSTRNVLKPKLFSIAHDLILKNVIFDKFLESGTAGVDRPPLFEYDVNNRYLILNVKNLMELAADDTIRSAGSNLSGRNTRQIVLELIMIIMHDHTLRDSIRLTGIPEDMRDDIDLISTTTQTYNLGYQDLDPEDGDVSYQNMLDPGFTNIELNLFRDSSTDNDLTKRDNEDTFIENLKDRFIRES